ncbi:hypothetical protein B0H13DRAFT_766787 [Mycena leptocephala]|nr:hypothetical protein B0H13DRAFT_766787 [Mycena leptocephala]
MALMALLSALALSSLCGLTFSVPVPDDNSTTPLLVLPILVADATIPVNQDSPLATVVDAVNTLLLAPPAPLNPITTAEDLGSLYLYPSYNPLLSTDTPQSAESISLVVTTVTEILTDTQVVFEPPATVTLSAAPSTVTDIVTIFVPTSPQPPPSSTSTAPEPSGAKAAWAAPAQMTDLSAWNISAFPAGQQNLRLVTGIPSSATPTSTAAASLFGAFLSPTGTPSSSYTAWDNASTVLQLLYPADSANPAARPVGGAEFYATPVDITSAQIATLGYSVFFPANFDWVKAGKLPGLYGGRMGCSGGDAALDCWSTRLMWRQHGVGELYLYAAKDKQTRALCADPQSVCDAAYGFSIGRGSFSYQAGGWTTVTQIVQLNTPGKQDGWFTLYVNGERKIQRSDVFYRDVPPTSANATKSSSASASSSTSDDDDDGDLLPPLGSLLGTLFDRRTMVQEALRDTQMVLFPAPTAAPQQSTVASASGEENDVALPSDAHEWAVQLPPAPAETDPASSAPAETTTASTVTTTVIVYPTLLSEQAAPQTEPVGFIGIFFSTFFGGHGASYATPRDQYVWFKDFNLVFNR